MGGGGALRVGAEGDDRGGGGGPAPGLYRALRHAPLVFLVIDLAPAVHPHLEALAQEVDGRHADAVQPGGHLVSAASELAAGVDAEQGRPEGPTNPLTLDLHSEAPTPAVHP